MQAGSRFPRLLAAIWLGNSIHFPDEAVYSDAAHRLVAGLGFADSYHREPVYPMMLALLSWPFPADIRFLRSIGVDAVGMRWPLMRQMMFHQESERTELLFAKNWANVKGEDIGYLQHALEMEEVVE